MLEEKKGRLLAEYNGVRIFDGFPFREYVVSVPGFSEKELDLAEKLEKILSRNASPEILQQNPLIKSPVFFDELKNNVIQAISASGVSSRLLGQGEIMEIKQGLVRTLSHAKTQRAEEIAGFVLKQGLGYGVLAVPMGDENLEEVMVNGSGRNVFVFHRELGMCRTNIVFEQEGLLVFIQKIARMIGREFNESEPLLDARLPDGNRANATYNYVTPNGHTLTIRKFTKAPISVIGLIEKNTLSSEVAALLWAMVEGMNAEPKNIIITGGSSSGKTTLMSVLAGFVPLNNRIISIEDTLEIDLGKRENWVQMESKLELSHTPAVTMNDLLKNALRMRPDRIIVGEVRGKEAQTLFVAMDTGHSGILGTMHSNSARECLVRLKTKPMSVPESMLPLLDLIIVMQRNYDRRRGTLRRIKHIAEVSRMEEKTLLSNIFEFSQKEDRIKKTDVPSHVLDDLAEKAGMTKNELRREILVRQRILEWMLENGIRKSAEVEKIIQAYYFDPRSVLEEVTKGFYPAK